MNIVTWLKSLLPQQSFPDLPKSAEDIGDYLVNFQRAAKFTSACGFPRIKVKWRSGNAIDEQGNAIGRTLQTAGVQNVDKSAGQCLKWCHFIAPAAQKELGCKVWVTIGQIWRNDKAVFNPTWADMKRWSSRGFQHEDFTGRLGINLHAWLTLETGEIIDPTYFSSLALVNPDAYGKMAGGVTWGRDPQVIHEHRYFPMAVGNEFVEAINEKSVVPLLATAPEDLPNIPCYFFLDGATR